MMLRPLDPFGVEGTWDMTIGDMRQAVLDHGLLLLRGRLMTPREQAQLTYAFGDAPHRAGRYLRWYDESPEVFAFSNDPAHGSLNGGEYWHCDGHLLRRPTAFAIHHMVVCDENATLYADLQAALGTFEGYEQEHLAALETETRRGVRHPLVIELPPTGKRMLYVNFAPGCRVVCINQPVPDKEAEIRQRLDILAYRHDWRPGDTILTNAFRAAHKTLPSYGGLKILHRSSLPVDAVWWNQRRSAA